MTTVAAEASPPMDFFAEAELAMEMTSEYEEQEIDSDEEVSSHTKLHTQPPLLTPQTRFAHFCCVWSTRVYQDQGATSYARGTCSERADPVYAPAPAVEKSPELLAQLVAGKRRAAVDAGFRAATQLHNERGAPSTASASSPASSPASAAAVTRAAPPRKRIAVQLPTDTESDKD